MRIYRDGSWQDVSSIKTFKNGAWQDIDSAKIYENGAWRDVYQISRVWWNYTYTIDPYEYSSSSSWSPGCYDITPYINKKMYIYIEGENLLNTGVLRVTGYGSSHPYPNGYNFDSDWRYKRDGSMIVYSVNGKYLTGEYQEISLRIGRNSVTPVITVNRIVISNKLLYDISDNTYWY